ncbi:MAG: hypothetical protein ACXVGF_04695 [Blastococcus sp.]
MTTTTRRPLEALVPTVLVSDHGTFRLVRTNWASGNTSVAWSCRLCNSYGYWQTDEAKALAGGKRHKCK